MRMREKLRHKGNPKNLLYHKLLVSGNLILLCHREESVPEIEQIEIIPGYTAFENEIKAVLIGYILNSNDEARQLLRTFHA